MINIGSTYNFGYPLWSHIDITVCLPMSRLFVVKVKVKGYKENKSYDQTKQNITKYYTIIHYKYNYDITTKKGQDFSRNTTRTEQFFIQLRL